MPHSQGSRPEFFVVDFVDLIVCVAHTDTCRALRRAPKYGICFHPIAFPWIALDLSPVSPGVVVVSVVDVATAALHPMLPTADY